MVKVNFERTVHIFKVFGEFYFNRKYSLVVAHRSHLVFRGTGKYDAICQVHLVQEEKARVEGKGESSLVLLPISFRIAKAEIDWNALIDAGGWQKSVGGRTSVEVLNCAGGGAAILADEVTVIADRGVGGEEESISAYLSTN